MSQRISQEFILDASLIPDAEVFSGYLETMASIEGNAEVAPESDIAFHQVALDGVKAQAREFLLARPDLIPFYKAAGSIAVTQAKEQLERTVQSSEQLIGYIKAGLLDSLTIDELEGRIKVARLKDSALSHHALLNAAFGNLLEDPKPKRPKKPTRTRRPKVTPEPEAELTIDENILSILEQADLSAEIQAFVYAALNGGAKLLTLRRENEAIKTLSDDEYVSFKNGVAQIREDISALFVSRGVKVDWEVAGKTRGTTYRLVSSAGRVEPESTSADTSSSAEDASYGIEQFSTHLFKVTELIIKSGQPDANRQSYISERIAEWLDITTSHASQLVDRQIKQGLLACTGIEKGSLLLEVIEQPVERVKSNTTSKDSLRITYRTESKDFTSGDLEVAKNLFDLLALVGGHNRGVRLKRLSGQMSISERDLTQFVGRLAKAGVCRVTRVLDESASTEQARKTTVLVKFPSRGAWNRFQTDSTEYLSILPTSK